MDASQFALRKFMKIEGTNHNLAAPPNGTTHLQSRAHRAPVSQNTNKKMINRFLTLTLATVVLCGTNGPAFAQNQNPLRRESESTRNRQVPHAESHGTTWAINPADATPEVVAAINNLPLNSVKPTHPAPARTSASALSSPANQQPPEPIVDEQVAPVVHLEPKNDMAPFIHILDSLSNRVPADNSQVTSQPIKLQRPVPDRATDPVNHPLLATSLRPLETELESPDRSPSTQRVETSKQFDREKFQTLIKKLGINTGIVICLGIGFIVIAKQYYKARSPGQKKKAQAPIQIKSTLQLSPKSNLHLIEAGKHSLIVATDQTGIKSMVRLTDSFASSLGSLEDLVDDFTDESCDANRQLDADNAGAYSLATLALNRALADPHPADSQRNNPNVDDRQMKPAAKKTPGQPATSGGDDQDEIRRQMEAALRDHGLKELILETLRKE